MIDPTDRATLDITSGGLRVGYARVSTIDQNLDLQRDALKSAGCVQLYEEKQSSRGIKGRQELANCMRALRAGDTLIVWRLDRLSGSMNDLVQIIHELTERKIRFESLNEKIDTKTAQGRMFIGVMAAMNQFRLDVIKENTMAGLDAARARGRNGGRPEKLDARKLREIRALLKDPELTLMSIAERYGVSRATIYNALKRDDAKREAEKAAKKKEAAKPTSRKSSARSR